jgi:serine/threonine-protein kinase
LVDFGLVKLLAPDDRTITVIQGRGTALYTPLEQYGGETGHTDVRSDIYSLGATLYHLLTNEPPVEAKQRFLNPNSLPLIRSVRPETSKRTALAIEWAMALHPDDRPANIEEFQRALLGRGPTPPSTPQRKETKSFSDAVQENRGLGITAIFLLIIAVVATLIFSDLPVP